MSQTALGDALGISFQQVQKYEKGSDRVAVSTLMGIAAALGMRPGSFLDEDMSLLGPAGDITSPGLRNAYRIGERIERLKNPTVVRRLIALVDAIAGVEAGAINGSGQTSDDDRQ